jgi:hypothetical protein
MDFYNDYIYILNFFAILFNTVFALLDFIFLVSKNYMFLRLLLLCALAHCYTSLKFHRRWENSLGLICMKFGLFLCVVINFCYGVEDINADSNPLYSVPLKSWLSIITLYLLIRGMLTWV